MTPPPMADDASPMGALAMRPPAPAADVGPRGQWPQGRWPRGRWPRGQWRLGTPVAAVAVIVGGMLARPRFGAAPIRALWLAGLVLLGAPIVWRAIVAAAHGRFATDLVASLAIVGAVALGEPLAGLVIVLMQSGGEALERYAEGRASRAVRALEAEAPRIAHRRHADGREIDVGVDAVAVGDALLVRPGEMVPCDAVVVDGRSHVDVARLTGEPMPVSAAPGTALMSGSLNVDGSLVVRATAVAGESQYARIVQLVRSAQTSKAPLQRLADRYAVWFTPATLAVCLATYLLTGDAARALAVLVVATPCPLILATPVAIIGGIDRAARRRVIVRHGGALEALAAVTTAVLDKTGTVTVGVPSVRHVVPIAHASADEVLRLAAAVERGSGHLLARAVVAAAERTAIGLPSVRHVTETAGRGVVGEVDGHRVVVGMRDFVVEDDPAMGAAFDEAEHAREHDAGLRAYVAVDGRAAGIIAFADRVRPELPGFLRRLATLGIRRIVLLSGDAADHTGAVAREIGIAEAFGELLPGDKVDHVRALEAGGERVLMIGDGTNDAPALSAASVGVAVAGAAGHGRGITAEAADVVLLADDLGGVADALGIGRRTLAIARQSIWAGLGLSAIAMGFAAAGMIPPTTGALLQEAIDVAVIVNALRASR
ncbi:MAG: heavy metal translocating P-type ATPase [Gemmatirosa sp.]|nr:heavy metal translocating P-type ATPase [Gemmatirosa sp.]